MPLLDEARRRFETVAKERSGPGAKGMASACITEQGDCLRDLGRLDEAAAAYEEASAARSSAGLTAMSPSVRAS
jgi:predicted negative regulator of RcsB-dependent stress response